MQIFTKSKNKIYSIIVSILLVIQPLAANKNINLNAGDEINLKAGENYQEYEYSRTSSSSLWGELKKKNTTTNYHEQDKSFK